MLTNTSRERTGAERDRNYECRDRCPSSKPVQGACNRMKRLTYNSQINLGQDSSMFYDKFAIKKTENPDSWRLIDIRADNEATMEEAVFTVQGILVLKELPPLLEKPK